MAAHVMIAAHAQITMRNVPRAITSASSPSARSVAASASLDASPPSRTPTTPSARFNAPAASARTPTIVTAVGRRSGRCETGASTSPGSAVVAKQAQALAGHRELARCLAAQHLDAEVGEAEEDQQRDQ